MFQECLATGDESYEQIEKGHFQEAQNGAKHDLDPEEAGKLE